MSKPTQTPDPYNDYGNNDDWKVAETRIDYAVMMKDVLTRLHDIINGELVDELNGALGNKPLDLTHALRLVNTALDYLFYLEDNRRVIL